MELRHPARDRQIESGRGGVRRVKGNPPDRFARHKSTAALERTGVRAPEPAIEDVNIIESEGDSIYHSLQARLEQRLWKGLSLLGSYTYAKSIDDASSFFSSTGDPNFPQNSYNLRAERGRSNFDVRQRFTLSYGYDLPLGKGRWLGGWQSFGVLTFQTGRPFTVADKGKPVTAIF